MISSSEIPRDGTAHSPSNCHVMEVNVNKTDQVSFFLSFFLSFMCRWRQRDVQIHDLTDGCHDMAEHPWTADVGSADFPKSAPIKGKV
jgi:hypothetical protein